MSDKFASATAGEREKWFYSSRFDNFATKQLIYTRRRLPPLQNSWSRPGHFVLLTSIATDLCLADASFRILKGPDCLRFAAVAADAHRS